MIFGLSGYDAGEVRSPRPRRPTERHDLLMGTLVSQRLYGRRTHRHGLLQLFPARRAAAAVARELARLERLWSVFRPGSEVRRIGMAAGRAPVTVHPDTFDILTRAKELSRVSGGRFDVTSAALTRLRREAAEEGKPPEPLRIRERLGLTDWSSLVLDRRGRSAFLPRSGQGVDLGGIGKGFAAERALALYCRFGICHAFINLGGNVLTMGGRPDGTPWRVGIRRPPSMSAASRSAVAALAGYVEVRDAAVVSSGGYERYFRFHGRNYHHIIDPSTGDPAKSDAAGVTVVSPSALDADALATAVFIMGSSAGLALLEELPQVEGLVIDLHGEYHLTSGMQELFVPLRF